MIHLLNRRQLAATSSLQEKAKICEALCEAGIEYAVYQMERNTETTIAGSCLSDPNFADREKVPGYFFALKRECACALQSVPTYYFYVKKKDHENALRIIECEMAE